MELILFSAIALIVLRIFMACSLSLLIPKNKRKIYRSAYSFLNRWFLFSAPDFLLTKCGKNVSKKSSSVRRARIFRAINIFEHALFAAALLGYILCRAGLFPKDLENIFGGIYCCNALIVFIAYSIDELAANWSYHKSRYRW